MTTKTLTALRGSIKKWKKIIFKKGIDKCDSNCPLCQLFMVAPACQGCPVAKITGPQCEDSPWEQWQRHHTDEHPTNSLRVICPTCLHLAKAELTFLKGLLPKGV